MTPARVLYVITNMEYGGSERQLCELVTGLDRRLFAPHICCLLGGGPLVDTLAVHGIPVTVLNNPAPDHMRKGRLALLHMAQVGMLARLMKRSRPDIVHAILPVACLVSGLAARCAGVPVLVTGRRSLRHYRRGRFRLRTVENAVNRWTDAVVANSEAVRGDALRWERLDPRKMHVIYNGVRIPTRGSPPEWRALIGRDIAGPVVCMVANFAPFKGHADFIAAAARVAEHVPRAVFVLVGDGKLRPEIERGVQETGCAGNFVLLGSRPDAAEIMASADIVALASHEEGFPNVVLEAMACAKPVVATKVGGVPEAVEDGVTGLLVPPHDPRAMADALARLLGNAEEAREMGRRGRERVCKRFTVERMVHEYEELYRALLARTGATAGGGGGA